MASIHRTHSKRKRLFLKSTTKTSTFTPKQTARITIITIRPIPLKTARRRKRAMCKAVKAVLTALRMSAKKKALPIKPLISLRLPLTGRRLIVATVKLPAAWKAVKMTAAAAAVKLTMKDPRRVKKLLTLRSKDPKKLRMLKTFRVPLTSKLLVTMLLSEKRLKALRTAKK